MDLKDFSSFVEGMRLQEMNSHVRDLLEPLPGFGSLNLYLREGFRRVAESREIARRFAPQFEIEERMRRLHMAVPGSYLSNVSTGLSTLARISEETALREIERWQDIPREMFDAIPGTFRLNPLLPTVAKQCWPASIFNQRRKLIQDSAKNLAGLTTLWHETAHNGALDSPLAVDQVGSASGFVINHQHFVHQLPPKIDAVEEDDTDDPFMEQVGPKLEARLAILDPRFVQLRAQAWRLLQGGTAGARMGMLGLRELFTEILHFVAPDAEVTRTDLWQSRSDRKLSRPSRRMRLEYSVGRERAAKLDALLQFTESIDHANKFAHTFADDPEVVRAHMGQLEIWIYLLIVCARKPL